MSKNLIINYKSKKILLFVSIITVGIYCFAFWPYIEKFSYHIFFPILIIILFFYSLIIFSKELDSINSEIDDYNKLIPMSPNDLISDKVLNEYSSQNGEFIIYNIQNTLFSARTSIVEINFSYLPKHVEFLRFSMGAFLILGLLGSFIGISNVVSGVSDLQKFQDNFIKIFNSLRTVFGASIGGLFSALAIEILVQNLYKYIFELEEKVKMLTLKKITEINKNRNQKISEILHVGLENEIFLSPEDKMQLSTITLNNVANENLLNLEKTIKIMSKNVRSILKDEFYPLLQNQELEIRRLNNISENIYSELKQVIKTSNNNTGVITKFIEIQRIELVDQIVGSINLAINKNDFNIRNIIDLMQKTNKDILIETKESLKSILEESSLVQSNAAEKITTSNTNFLNTMTSFVDNFENIRNQVNETLNTFNITMNYYQTRFESNSEQIREIIDNLSAQMFGRIKDLETSMKNTIQETANINIDLYDLVYQNLKKGVDALFIENLLPKLEEIYKKIDSNQDNWQLQIIQRNNILDENIKSFDEKLGDIISKYDTSINTISFINSDFKNINKNFEEIKISTTNNTENMKQLENQSNNLFQNLERNLNDKVEIVSTDLAKLDISFELLNNSIPSLMDQFKSFKNILENKYSEYNYSTENLINELNDKSKNISNAIITKEIEISSSIQSFYEKINDSIPKVNEINISFTSINDRLIDINSSLKSFEDGKNSLEIGANHIEKINFNFDSLRDNIQKIDEKGNLELINKQFINYKENLGSIKISLDKLNERAEVFNKVLAKVAFENDVQEEAKKS